MERNRMKQKSDQHWSECTFQVGGMVFILLQPYKKSSLKIKGCLKMAPKLYGLYKVLSLQETPLGCSLRMPGNLKYF